ncbi:hypothetical protein [Thalassotalea sp. G2M2-11]|uniref:hypothetical protein n=1 Tax=Thalassotalea sp. G2M2-11 TaxID=2787627 RepID=UPI0019D2126F|nr:hypothetical protein [Thalassotalea sp. G2M2-11]
MKSWLVSEKEHLIQQINQSTLPHALLISGVAGAGKYELAHWLAQTLACELSQNTSPSNVIDDTFTSPCGQCKACHLFIQQTHPDHLEIAAEKNSIGVEQIRASSRFFEKTAQLGRNQTVMILAAEQMTESAANALLKTLEEPTPKSYVILLVNDVQHMLPTIISRCRQIQLRPPVGKHLVNELNQHSDDAFINLSHLAELTDNEVNQAFKAISKQFVSFLYHGKQRMTLLATLEQQPHNLRWLEKMTVDLFRNAAKWGSFTEASDIAPQAMAEYFGQKRDELYQVYQLINSYNKKVVTYSQFNHELGLEKLLVDIQLVMSN